MLIYGCQVVFYELQAMCSHYWLTSLHVQPLTYGGGISCVLPPWCDCFDADLRKRIITFLVKFSLSRCNDFDLWQLSRKGDLDRTYRTSALAARHNSLINLLFLYHFLQHRKTLVDFLAQCFFLSPPKKITLTKYRPPLCVAGKLDFAVECRKQVVEA